MNTLESASRNFSLEETDERMPFPVILAIDPSMNNLGWAAHNLNLGCNRYDIDSDAWRFNVIHPATLDRRGSELSKQHKWEHAYLRLRKGLKDWKPSHFAGEYPTFFNSHKGRIAAAQDYTLDLAGILGYLVGRLMIPSDFVSLWLPFQWKWNVPKDVTREKFKRLFGKGADSIVRNYSHDVIDAIMIAEHWLTLYHREKFPWQKRKLSI